MVKLENFQMRRIKDVFIYYLNLLLMNKDKNGNDLLGESDEKYFYEILYEKIIFLKENELFRITNMYTRSVWQKHNRGPEFSNVYVDRFGIIYFVNISIEDRWMLDYISKLIYEYVQDDSLDVTRLKRIVISKNNTLLFDRYNNTDSSTLVFNYNDDNIIERLLDYCGKKDSKKNTGN